MSREDPYFRLRIPAELKALVEAASEANRRSMTAEILARLQASFEQVDEDDAEAIREQFLGLRDTVAELQERLERYAARNQEREALYDRIAEMLNDVTEEGKVIVNPARTNET